MASVLGYLERRQKLSARLVTYLRETGDPRETSKFFDWDGSIYLRERDKNPAPSEKAIETLGLEERYSHVEL